MVTLEFTKYILVHSFGDIKSSCAEFCTHDFQWSCFWFQTLQDTDRGMRHFLIFRQSSWKIVTHRGRTGLTRGFRAVLLKRSLIDGKLVAENAAIKISKSTQFSPTTSHEHEEVSVFPISPNNPYKAFGASCQKSGTTSTKLCKRGYMNLLGASSERHDRIL